jgi:hypothetical protein
MLSLSKDEFQFAGLWRSSFDRLRMRIEDVTRKPEYLFAPSPCALNQRTRKWNQFSSGRAQAHDNPHLLLR